MMSLKPSPATQSEVDGQEIPVRKCGPIVVLVQALAPPVGSVDASTPSPLIATQNDADGQEIPEMDTPAVFHELAPPVGSVDVRMLPASSPATQTELEGHVRARISRDLGSCEVARQAANPLESSTKESSDGWAGTGKRLQRTVPLPLPRS
jgi:hypothetical protein